MRSLHYNTKTEFALKAVWPKVMCTVTWGIAPGIGSGAFFGPKVIITFWARYKVLCGRCCLIIWVNMAFGQQSGGAILSWGGAPAYDEK